MSTALWLEDALSKDDYSVGKNGGNTLFKAKVYVKLKMYFVVVKNNIHITNIDI